MRENGLGVEQDLPAGRGERQEAERCLRSWGKRASDMLWGKRLAASAVRHNNERLIIKCDRERLRRRLRLCSERLCVGGAV